MNKKLVSGLLAATLLVGGTSVFAQDNTTTTEKEKKETATKVTGLENALQNVKNETARQAIMTAIQNQNQKQNVTTGDSVTVTPAPAKDKNEKPVKEKQGVVTVKINGKIMIADQKPIIINGRTVVPLRSIFEALGADIKWDNIKQTVHAVKDKNKVEVKIGDLTAVVNGKKVKLDQKAFMVNNRTMVPVRFVSEALGADVQWDAKNLTIHITMKK
ncbi:copper amine oxidase N-terminal domain-containing protein [Aneurinibacillus migulanus]|uniref:Copper amine oxidase N-terminal domain-containing protein n=2 Tax=Aneurinibacillus migulanus TaxID=47500 RepID=A0A1G8MKL6_ANEMI|nr:copper amine oxidase N-terminal domain-containing protein [Aneurinibacillus migulanus]MED0893653.1 copper amine oxidase N-terminal domain-containing protein [Aneurinibacillus migulanus]MED1617843.1 copper amine oxidase N-terminal domain-containing protein [Aneurinibacillus migulanus]MED4728468.1 copper amine oxidase N-terminal domain-containing protein [Aneurinibacillus migulanus]SDI68414.1 Copper amine oxidase N-terminal domain-containing protein [Aneurinibacillus migulanus]GED12674.1 hypo